MSRGNLYGMGTGRDMLDFFEWAARRQHSDEEIAENVNQDFLPVEEYGTGAFLDNEGKLCHGCVVDEES